MSNTRPCTTACDGELIVRRYASLANLTSADTALLRSMANASELLAAGAEIESEGFPRTRPRLLVSGWACRFRIVADGRRMILGILLPGDSLGLRRREQATALASIATLSPCRLVNAMPLWLAVNAMENRHRPLVLVQQALSMLDDGYTLSHIVRLGRLSAEERICHLLLELHWRLTAVGLAYGNSFCLPLTYDSLADTVGLSVVHVNRTLQTLRRKRLIELHHGRVKLLDIEAMGASCDFRPVTLPSVMRSHDLRVVSQPA